MDIACWYVGITYWHAVAHLLSNRQNHLNNKLVTGITRRCATAMVLAQNKHAAVHSMVLAQNQHAAVVQMVLAQNKHAAVRFWRVKTHVAVPLSCRSGSKQTRRCATLMLSGVTPLCHSRVNFWLKTNTPLCHSHGSGSKQTRRCATLMVLAQNKHAAVETLMVLAHKQTRRCATLMVLAQNNTRR